MASRLCYNFSTRALSRSRSCNSNNFTSASFALALALALARRSPANVPAAFPTLPLIRRNTMATSDAPKKVEWLVVVPDFPGAQEKRLAVRP